MGLHTRPSRFNVEVWYYGSLRVPEGRNFSLCYQLQFLLYGLYVEMFGICVHILLTRKQGRYHRLLVAMILQFLLCTADVALTTAYDILALARIENYSKTQANLQVAHFMMILASNATADAILLSRCYIVWGRRWKIIVLPLFAYIGSHFTALAMMAFFGSAVIQNVLAGATAFNNLLLSSLIAFRIYKMSRNAKTYLGPRPMSMYKTLIAISLESGIIYAALLLLVLGLTLTHYSVDSGLVDFSIRSWSVISGMMPTAIIVRVALGISFDDVESSIASIQGRDTYIDLNPVIDISKESEFTTYTPAFSTVPSLKKQAKSEYW
uniref:Integral membrane protein n=1 Tax=Moniliophthora roreri TaxID=221103 RepID=A0A0W0FDX1_MONRR